MCDSRLMDGESYVYSMALVSLDLKAYIFSATLPFFWGIVRMIMSGSARSVKFAAGHNN